MQWTTVKDNPPSGTDADDNGDVLMRLPNGNAVRCPISVAIEREEGQWMRTDEWVDEEGPVAMSKEEAEAKVAEIQMAMANLFTGLKELGVALGWKERK